MYFQAHSHFSWIIVTADFTSLKKCAWPQIISEVVGFQGKRKGLELGSSAFLLTGLSAGAPSTARAQELLDSTQPVRKPWPQSQPHGDKYSFH